jgi:hypothetical protein
MIVYHDIIPNNYAFYKANTITTLGSFIESEWDKMNTIQIKIIDSSYSTLQDYINNEFNNDLNIGDYVKLNNNALYLLFQNNGVNVTDYIELNDATIYTIAYIISNQNSLQDYISNEWTPSSIKIGNILILQNQQETYILYQNNGDNINDYILLSPQKIYWNNIINKPNSTIIAIDNAVLLAHEQNTDTYLDYGGTNQVSAEEIKNHINDSTIHFTKDSLSLDHNDLTSIGIYTHDQIDNHINDTSIHFSQTKIDHYNLLHVGTLTHDDIDNHIIGAIHTHNEIDQHLDAGTYTHDQIDNHINDTSIHFSQTEIDHTNLINKGFYTHQQIDDHINNNSIHLTESNIDHYNILHVGIYTHDQIDSHINDTSIHFEISDINHDSILNNGFYTHDQIDNHINDTSIHFSQTEINHANLINKGFYTHQQIDDHINDTNIHFAMNDISININQIIDLPIIYGNGVNSIKTRGINLFVESDNSGVICGTDNKLESSALNSLILGGHNITGDLPNMVYVPQLNVAFGKIKNDLTEFVTWKGSTNNDIYTELFLKDGTRYNISKNTSIMFVLYVSAYNISDNAGKIMEIRGGIKRDENDVNLIGNGYSKYIITQDDNYDTSYTTGNWDISIIANDIDNALTINVRGEDNKNIIWSITGIMTITNI